MAITMEDKLHQVADPIFFRLLENVLKSATIVAKLRTDRISVPKQPIELMFGGYRRQLLATLLLRPDEKFHVRELERMTGISAGSIHRDLKAMAESGLLLRKHMGNQVQYQANQTCPIYNELAAIFRKTIGLASLLHDSLRDLARDIEFVFVFGSMATGRQTHASDVDLLVLGDVSLIEVVKALSPVQVTLGREINPVVMAVNRFLAQLEKKERFATRVMTEPKIFVMGGEDEFAELAKDPPAG
jgi:predicted nucleotidyltransferase/DNA-binding HxlR family transcriptional regulator